MGNLLLFPQSLEPPALSPLPARSLLDKSGGQRGVARAVHSVEPRGFQRFLLVLGASGEVLHVQASQAALQA